MVLTGAEIAALKNALRKAASALGKAALTGPGSGAGSVEKRVRASRVPGLERRKQTIESGDAERFARKILQRVSGQGFTLPGKAKPQKLEIPAADVDSLVAGVGILMSALPGRRVTMALMLAVDFEPEVLADRMRRSMPEAAAVVGAVWAPVLDELIGIVCEHIAEFFTTKENFRAAADQELLRRSGRRYQPEQEAELLAAYARLVREKSHKIRLFGLDLREDDQSYDLMTGFVDLTVETTLRTDGEAGRPDTERVSWNGIDELVFIHGRILLEGPAGSGKSTLMQWLTLNGLAEQTSRQVPFLIRLREFVGDQRLRLPQPVDFIATLAAPLAGRLPGWELQLLTEGQALVLVDGLDEIPEQLRGDALRWLEELVTAYPHAHYVVTTRPAGLEEADRTRLVAEFAFTRAVVEPMSTDQVAVFVDRWHAAAANRPDADLDELWESATALMQAIRSRRDLARITTTPLLCAMVCALYRADNGALPRNRIALYERACTMLLEKRDSHQKIQTFPVSLSKDQIEPFLTEIALWMLVNKQRGIQHDVALELVAEELPRLRIPDGPPKWKPTAQALLRHLIVRSGVLQEPTMDLLEFVHPSFQDYFAAKGVFRRSYLPHLIENAHDAMYQDVAVMAVSQVQNDRERQDQLLEGLIERAKSDRAQARQLYLLAAACVADAGMADPVRVEEIRKKTRSLLPPRSTREAQSIAAAGGFALDLLADTVQTKALTVAEASATIRAVGLMGGGGEVGLQILQTLAEDFKAHVASPLMSAWNQVQDPALFFEEVLSRGDFSGFYVYADAEEQLGWLEQLPGMDFLEADWPLLNSDSAGVTNAPRGVSILSRLTRLRGLVLKGAEGGDLQDIDRFDQLVHLAVSHAKSLDLQPLVSLPRLATLSISDGQEPDLSPLRDSTTLRELTLSGVLAADLTDLAGLPHLQSLSALGTEVRSRTPLKHVTHLRVDTLNGHDEILPRVKDLNVKTGTPDVQALARFQRLTSLRLGAWGEPLELDGLEALPHLSHLTVNVERDPVHGLPGLGISSLALNYGPHSGLDALKMLPHLAKLVLSNVPASAMQELPHLPALWHIQAVDREELRLPRLDRFPGVTELIAGAPSMELGRLSHLPALSQLTILDCHTFNVKPLAKLEGLRRLRLHRVQRFDLPALRRLEQLTQLELDGDRRLKPEFLPPNVNLILLGISDLSARELAAFPTLRGILFNAPPEQGFAAFSEVPQLEILALESCPDVRVEELATWPNLRDLNLDNVPGLDFEALSRLPHLTDLYLNHMPYSGIHVLSNLEILKLADTAVELPELLSLPKLRHLILEAVPDSGLSLLASLPALKKLELVDMPWADLSAFQARPDIEIIQR